MLHVKMLLFVSYCLIHGKVLQHMFLHIKNTIVCAHVCYYVCALVDNLSLWGIFIAFKSSFSDLSEVIACDNAINHCPAILRGAVKRLRIENTFISERERMRCGCLSLLIYQRGKIDHILFAAN